jgi:hypothetical protein
MTKDNAHAELARAIMSPDSSEEDVLLFMLLLHTLAIYLKPDVVLEDAPDRDPSIPLPAISRNAAARAVSSIWPTQVKKGSKTYWHGLYCEKTPYESLAQVPPTAHARLNELKSRLEMYPLIERVAVEE